MTLCPYLKKYDCLSLRSLLLAEEARGGERRCRGELRILEVMGLYSVDGKRKPP